MKNFLNALYELAISIGQVRAAAALARSGMYTEAKDLMATK